MSTNIDSSNIENLSVLVNVIELLLDGKCDYSIELRHNSPWDIFIPIFADPNSISFLISTISLVFSAIQTKIAVEQSLRDKNDQTIDYQTIKICKSKLKNNNIVIINLTINNNGDIMVK